MSDVRVQYELAINEPIEYLTTSRGYTSDNTPLDHHHSHFILQDCRNVSTDFRLKCESHTAYVSALTNTLPTLMKCVKLYARFN